MKKAKLHIMMIYDAKLILANLILLNQSIFLNLIDLFLAAFQ